MMLSLSKIRRNLKVSFLEYAQQFEGAAATLVS
jgi:hypothetical protein